MYLGRDSLFPSGFWVCMALVAGTVGADSLCAGGTVPEHHPLWLSVCTAVTDSVYVDSIASHPSEKPAGIRRPGNALVAAGPGQADGGRPPVVSVVRANLSVRVANCRSSCVVAHPTVAWACEATALHQAQSARSPPAPSS